MTRILIRGTKSPLDAVPAERVLDDNLIANNSGNLLFLETAFKVLSTRDAEVIPDRLVAHRLGADEINERFDVYVIPLANAFRASFEETLVRLTAVIEKLTIPVVVLGVGVQTAKSHAPGAIRPFDDSVKAFVRAVLDRSPSIGVRGEIDRGLPQGARVPRRRGHRLPVDVPARRPAGGHQAAEPRPRCPDRDGHHPADRAARSDRQPSSRALPELRIHRPGHRGAPPPAVGREPSRRRRHGSAAELPRAPAGPRRQVGLLRRPVAVDRPHASDRLRVRDADPWQHRGGPRGDAQPPVRARRPDARARPLLRAPAPGPPAMCRPTWMRQTSTTRPTSDR